MNMTNGIIENDSPENPFKAAKYGNVQTYYMVAGDRLRRVKEFSLEECEAALRVRGLQMTVRRAIQSRMRAIKNKEWRATERRNRAFRELLKS
jgi:hypothetical protein